MSGRTKLLTNPDLSLSVVVSSSAQDVLLNLITAAFSRPHPVLSRFFRARGGPVRIRSDLKSHYTLYLLLVIGVTTNITF